MGRKRSDSSQGLEGTRLYLRSGSFYYVHRDINRWENVGKDLAAAKKRAEHYNDPAGTFGLIAWFLDQFIIECEARAKVKSLSPRTVDDYRETLPPLKAFFGTMIPSDIKPSHVMAYLDLGVKLDRGTRANRERATLSACLSWMLRTDQGSLIVNPCMRASGVRRNPENQRERYVTDAEYWGVYDHSPLQVQLMMELIYRTLQRPEVDIPSWTQANIKRKGEERVLRFVQGKTGQKMDIGIVGVLDDLLNRAMGAVPVLHQPLIHTRRGEDYTYGGISSMLKRAQAKARKAIPALKDMPSFGFRDLKGKGATDMWLAGSPIEQIQQLCGHKTKTTTEKYIKARWSQTVAPNSIVIGR
jgi:integrase